MPAFQVRASSGMARRRRTIIVALLAGVVIAVLCFFTLGSSEPEYRGKPMSEWVGRLIDKYPRRDGEARDALRAMGQPAVKALTRYLDHTPTAWRRRLASMTAEIPMVNRLCSVDTFDRLIAAKALAEIGPTAKTAIPVLERAAKEPDFRLSLAARAALIRIREESVDSSVAIYRQFETTNSAKTAFLLMELGPYASPALPALLEGMKSTNYRVRLQAVWALSAVSHESPEYIPPVLRLLSDPHELVRMHAIDGLANFGPVAATALAQVQRSLQDTNHLVRCNALLFFDKVLSDEQFMTVRDEVIRAKQETNSTVSDTAAYVLSRRPHRNPLDAPIR